MVKLKNIAALYSITIGITMMGMWFSLIMTNQVQEMKTESIRITYHLIGEFLTAIFLVIGGFGLFTNRGWGLHVFLISMGMLLYTVIVSAGYYWQKEDTIMFGMFTIFQILTFIVIGLSFLKRKEVITK